MTEEPDNLQLKFNRQAIEWRGSKVLELSSKGQSQTEIAHILKVAQSTISVDLQYLKCHAAEVIKTYVTETLPFEFNKTITGFSVIIKEGFKMLNDTSTDNKDKISLLSVLMEAYEKRMNLQVQL